MNFNLKYFRVIVSVIILTLPINSCRKDQPTCHGNCAAINITGNTYIKTNNAALPNVPVEVNWFRKGYCIVCTSYKVASGETDDNGRFDLNVTIDTTFFHDYFLSVRVPIDTNYITVSGGGGVNYNEVRFDAFHSNELQNLKFEFYPKTYLTITLHRTLSDSFNYFSVNHNFTNEFDYADYIITGPQYANDTTFRVTTSADIYTRIVWRKTVVAGQSNEQIDSLICTRNGTNVFDINY